MSYSFNIRAATAALAVAAATAKFDEVVQQQPVHENDREPALAAVSALVGLLGAVPEDQEISVNVAGSVQWWGGDGETPRQFSGASLNVHAGMALKAPASE